MRAVGVHFLFGVARALGEERQDAAPIPPELQLAFPALGLADDDLNRGVFQRGEVCPVRGFRVF